MTDPINWRDEIGGLLQRHGPLTTEKAAELLDREGAVPKAWKRDRWRQALKRKVRRTLQEKQENGLPVFGQQAEPDESGDHRWVQAEFLGLEGWMYELEKRVEQRDALQEEIDRIADHIHNRFGFRPTVERVPGLTYGDEHLLS